MKSNKFKSSQNLTYLANMWKYVNIHICYGYLNKFKEPLVSDTDSNTPALKSGNYDIITFGAPNNSNFVGEIYQILTKANQGLLGEICR